MFSKRLLFFFDQYFPVRLGENVYFYVRRLDDVPMVRAVISLLAVFLRRLANDRTWTTMPKQPTKNVIYIETVNQRNAIHSFLEKMGYDRVLLVLNENINHTGLEFAGKKAYTYLPAAALYGRAILCLPRARILAPVLFRKYSGRVSRTHILINLALFLSAVGWFGKLLDRSRPLSVTVVNDHNLFPLALLFAARQRQITSIYIQHAAVSAVFPKLLANVALLEGQQAKETYDRTGNFARQYRLVGIPRMDGSLGLKGDLVRGRKLAAGLCVKPFYSHALLDALVAHLKKTTRISEIILRPHPGNSAAYQASLRTFGVEISDSKSEDAMSFLKRVDVLISGESTIILEAALMKIPALYFDDGSFFHPFDLYGFVRNKIAYAHVRSPEDIPKVIEEIDNQKVKDIYLNCKYYCSTVGTEFENKSLQLMTAYYQGIL